MHEKSEKIRTQGYRDGVNAERLQTINLLQRIADSDDIESALLDEIDRLTTVQAHSVSAAAGGSQREQATQLAETITASRGVGGKDLVDTVAEMMRGQRTGAQ